MTKQGWALSPLLCALAGSAVLAGLTWPHLQRSQEPVPAAPAFQRSPEVEAFIRQHYIHAIPYAEGRALGGSAVPTLLELLGDAREDDYLANTVLVLGLVGGPDVTPALVDVLERRYMGAVPHWQYLGLLTVNVALGNLANRGDAGALGYLVQGADPAFWGDRVAWSQETMTRGELQDLLAKMAIFGLGLSGKPAALSRLQELSQPGDDSFRDNVAEAIELHGRIVRDGIDVVFANQGR